MITEFFFPRATGQYGPTRAHTGHGPDEEKLEPSFVTAGTRGIVAHIYESSENQRDAIMRSVRETKLTNTHEIPEAACHFALLCSPARASADLRSSSSAFLPVLTCTGPQLACTGLYWPVLGLDWPVPASTHQPASALNLPAFRICLPYCSLFRISVSRLPIPATRRLAARLR